MKVSYLKVLRFRVGYIVTLLAPLLLTIALLVLLKSKASWVTIAAALSVVTAAIAMSLALYRGYYSSLGL